MSDPPPVPAAIDAVTGAELVSTGECVDTYRARLLADGTPVRLLALSPPAADVDAVVDGVLTLAERHRLVGMNAVNGAPRWRYDADDELLGSPVVATHGLYVVGRAHTIHALGSSGT